MDHTIDSEIHHLERVLSLEIAHQVFSIDYWRGRVTQLTTANGLVAAQMLRLQRLLDFLEDRERAAVSAPEGAGNGSTRAGIRCMEWCRRRVA
ncbi:hypothetical protein B0G57_109108 [Trinickia symbiotica]|uniref:Uncharacterized protein n=1 Tax=Trinickia symbiotica TaxID=863227 RepID=A0A2N7X7I8_9BURK|nr:hypothetical protein [Trinickia symbiotica]PMS37729.1 hypothetical protein C0Z20_07195 [Trinickia symbiotica]PPK44272.1 hypothetical protein B0G57_109108 [Trinickia symbiotica]